MRRTVVVFVVSYYLTSLLDDTFFCTLTVTLTRLRHIESATWISIVRISTIGVITVTKGN
jgi:hypothetical protein